MSLDVEYVADSMNPHAPQPVLIAALVWSVFNPVFMLTVDTFVFFEVLCPVVRSR